ncbi:MAG: C39 family peptidase [Acidobacteria bacterium]|nr:C39 family peptidase [Acidobacteriota bacterium]
MWNVSSIERTAAVLLVGAMLSVAERGVAASVPGQSEVHALLDVPYVSQTPELCGGAAVAMVLRYWGERGVFPQDFAPLVGEGDGGIFTSALTSAVRDRGWQAFVVPAGDDPAHTRIRSEIDRGRPLIALIEVGTNTYHYVVIVGSTDQEVVFHDPARAPFRVLRWAEFDRAWTATRRWMMLVLPQSGIRPGDDAARATPASSDVAVHADQTPCSALVERGVHMALTGDREGAEQGLVAGTRLCPNDPASWRELAGLRFSQSRWSEAQDLALSAVRLAPEDAYAWQLVATSRYLMGNVMGALDAWNRTGEPRIDTTDIHGAERTRQPVVVRAAGLQPRQVLTAEAFGRALRRLRDLPVASNARMRYEPIDGGLATLDVFIDERKVVPSGWIAAATIGTSAWLVGEVRIDVAGPLGAGEVESALWRWAAKRPAVALGLALPSPQWLPGIISFDASWERQSYGATPSSNDATLVREERRRVGLNLADWSTSWLRWQTGAALDRLREYGDLDQNRFDARDYLALESTLNVRLAGDRLAVAASVGWWAPFAGGNRFGTGGLLAAWRSTDDATVPSWSVMTEIAVASRAAPLALWQGAGTGLGRSGLLRAHPLISGDVMTGPVFGREVAHGSLEYVQPVGRVLVGAVSIAGFVDAARAWHRLNGLDTSPLYIDAGVGLRVRARGLSGGIRIDVAHGLRDGGTTLSAGWAPWPR